MSILNSGVGNYVMSEGRKYSYFGGNNYLGLSNHSEVKAASIRAIEKYGVNFSASRQTTGTSDLHLELESKLAAFKGEEDAVIFASGYLGNSILLESIKHSYSAVFLDRFAHPSIEGSIRLKSQIFNTTGTVIPVILKSFSHHFPGESHLS